MSSPPAAAAQSCPDAGEVKTVQFPERKSDKHRPAISQVPQKPRRQRGFKFHRATNRANGRIFVVSRQCRAIIIYNFYC